MEKVISTGGIKQKEAPTRASRSILLTIGPSGQQHILDIEFRPSATFLKCQVETLGKRERTQSVAIASYAGMDPHSRDASTSSTPSLKSGRKEALPDSSLSGQSEYSHTPACLMQTLSQG
jgi:hypothetical protein